MCSFISWNQCQMSLSCLHLYHVYTGKQMTLSKAHVRRRRAAPNHIRVLPALPSIDPLEYCWWYTCWITKCSNIHQMFLSSKCYFRTLGTSRGIWDFFKKKVPAPELVATNHSKFLRRNLKKVIVPRTSYWHSSLISLFSRERTSQN